MKDGKLFQVPGGKLVAADVSIASATIIKANDVVVTTHPIFIGLSYEELANN